MAITVSSFRPQYERLFETCAIKPSKLSTVNSIVQKIIKNRTRYEGVADPLNVPQCRCCPFALGTCRRRYL